MTPTRHHAPAAPSRRTVAPPATVTVVLLARDRAETGRCLGSLLAQQHVPDRLVLVDTSLDGLGEPDDLLGPVDAAGIDVLRTRLDPGKGTRRVLRSIVDSLPVAEHGRDLVWVLASRSNPHPDCLRHLVAASGGKVGIAAPKLVDADDPRRLVRFGLQATQDGRLVPEPRYGTVDQGQYDESGGVDLLAAPLDGALLDRETYLDLGGHVPGLGDLGGDLDLGWRAQRAGRRVVGVPAARVAVRPTRADQRPSGAHRRQARRAAMARTALASSPLRALWLALVSVITGLGLLVLKRPTLAREELTQVPALLDPRTLRSRFAARGPREVSRSDLSSLFVSPETARSRTVDEVRGRRGQDGVDARSLETEGGGWLTHPMPWLLAAVIAMSAIAGRSITEAMRHRLDAGLVGGELLGGRATSGQLLDTWRLAWNGSGWGSATEQSPAVLVLAVAAWVVERVPGLSDAQSPAGLALAVLVVVALPLGAVVAYRAARTLTPRRWVRAVAALAWVSTAPAAAAVGEGRAGALLAIVLLPRVAAGLVRAARRGSALSDAVRTALWSALLGVFVPVLGAMVVAVGVLWLVVGPSGRRARGIALAAIPLLLAGPWLLTLQQHPRAVLGGWGTTAGVTDLEPWQLALGQTPGAPVLWWWTAAVLLVGLVSLLAPGRRPLAWACVVVSLLGLAWAVGAPHVVLGERPAGDADLGAPITPWVGLGLLLLVGSSLVAALSAADVLPERLRAGRRALLWVPVLVLAVAAIGSTVSVARGSFGETLTTWREPRPLVAVTTSEGALATRTLLVQREDQGVVYRLLGSEPAPLVRDVPLPETRTPAQEDVADVVAQLLGAGGDSEDPAGDVLAEQGIGYVVVADPSEADRRLVDAMPGLSRLGTSAGTTTWTVRPELTGESTPSRLRLVKGETSVAARGAGTHAETDDPVPTEDADRLVVAESLDWSDHATVRAGDTALRLDHRHGTPTYLVPEDADSVSVDVGTGHPLWKLLQGLTLLLGLYLALPTELRTDEDDDEEAPV